MRNNKVLQLCIDSLFLAIIIILTFVPYTGYISIPGVGISITILHVVVLIGAICFGFKRGLLYGFIFGLTSLIKAVSMPSSVIDPLFINPLISILPRMVFGGLSGYTFSLIKKLKNKKIMYVLFYINSGVMSLIHSFLTLSMLYVFNLDNVDVAGSGYFGLLASIITINGIIELVLAMLITPNVAIALFKGFPKLTNYRKEEENSMSKRINYDELLNKYHDEALNTLKQFVSIDSSYDKKSVSEADPFGKGVSKALNYITGLAIKDGFRAINYDNKVVEISYGEGDKDILVLAHADVVPATGKWSYNPFEVTLKDDILYGRGVSDDKGPLICCYYALKAIKENNLAKDYKIRFVIGGNEENGSECVKYYFDTLKKPQPTYGFTPDSEFPIVYGEKGFINFNIKGSLKLEHLISITSGVAYNAVIDKTIIKVDDEKIFNLLSNKNLIDESTFKDGVYTIIHYGKSAHGSTPELGVNSSIEILNALKEYYKDNEQFINLMNFITPLDGSGLNIEGYSKDMGNNSFNVGLLNYGKDIIDIGVNFRYVNGCDENIIKNNIVANLKDYKISFLESSKLLYFDKKSPLIKTLLKSYQRVSKDKKSKPITTGGGTYAKEANNTVAFGMQHADFPTHMHEADEQIRLSDFYLAMKIYLDAILSLGKLISKK